MNIPIEWSWNTWANVTGYEDRFFEIQENVRNILENTNLNTILTGIGIGLLLILGTVIIINQIRIRKQLRRIQEQLEATSSGDRGTIDETNQTP